MLKFAVVMTALVAVALAAPVEETISKEAPIGETISKEAPIDEAIPKEAPIDETVSEEAPIGETISKEAPIDETIYDEAHVEETASEQATTIPILWQTQQGPNPDGSYDWAYEAANGVAAQEKGTLKEVGTGDDVRKVIVVEGSFTYIQEDGTRVELTYVADENGFRAMGSHLPTPPPMPPAIFRSLEWIKTHSTTNEPTPTNSADSTEEEHQ